MNEPKRKSTRLKGFDYSEPSAYFVTICTRERTPILGEIVSGEMRLSDAGRIVELIWQEIPAHFENVHVDVFQIMPNHVHGIIEIRETSRKSRRDVACNVPTGSSRYYSTISPKPKSLGTIIRSFKSAVTKHVHNLGMHKQQHLWQSRFHDRIVRSDVEYFFTP